MDDIFSFPAKATLEDQLVDVGLGIRFGKDDKDQETLRFSAFDPTEKKEKWVEWPFDRPKGFSGSSFSFETLTDTVSLEIKLPDSGKKAFGGAGVAGFNPFPEPDGAGVSVTASLASVTVVLRPRPAGSDWSSAAPCFALVACWDLEVKEQTSGKFGCVDETGKFGTKADASIEVCVGFSAIFPKLDQLGLPALQLRLDMPSFGLTTNWLPLGLFDFVVPEASLPPWPLFRVDGLVKWFWDLLTIAKPEIKLPNFKFVLPEYDLDIPATIDLPLGIGAEETWIRVVRRGDDGYAVEAGARNFILTWGGEPIELGGTLILGYKTAGGEERYWVEATLIEGQHPRADDPEPKPYKFALPFDVLAIEAECWQFKVGLFMSNKGGKRACFQAMLEIGGLDVTSSLRGDEGGKGFFHTDVRLLLRDLNVMTNDMTSGNIYFLEGATNPKSKDVFGRYQKVRIAALSFAADLFAAPDPTKPANDYGMKFLDGEFRSGERLLIAWSQKGMQFLRALAHDLLGGESASQALPDEAATLFALEFARFDQGTATQVRLDWRPSDQPELPAPNPGSPIALPPKPGANGCIPVTGDAIRFSIPVQSGGVQIAPPAGAVSFDLPAVKLLIARPATQSIILSRSSDRSTSASHLLHFPAATAAKPNEPLAPLAYAQIGFSLADRNDAREVLETRPTDGGQGPFLSLAVGTSLNRRTALRTIGWRRGASPRFLQVLDRRASALTPIILDKPADGGSGDPGCPGPAPAPTPVARLDFDAFGTPAFSEGDWRLSVYIKAQKQLFNLFGDGSDQSVSFDITHICFDESDPDAALIKTNLTFRIGEFTASGQVTFRFDVRELSLSVQDGANLALNRKVGKTPGWAKDVPTIRQPDGYLYGEPLAFLGLEMTSFMPKLKDDKGNEADQQPAEIDFLTLKIERGRFLLALPENVSVILRYTGLGNDALMFMVTRLKIGPGGVDLDAELMSASLRVKGLNKPFILEQADLRIRSGRLEHLAIAASGSLPKLLNDAPLKVVISFVQAFAGGPIDLDEISCTLGEKNQPIFTRGTRFKFEISALDVRYVRETPSGDRHFFFEVSGSAQFTPDHGEFAGGLLEDLKSARIEFVRAPLTDEFHKSLSMVVELKRPVEFQVFNLFRMEIRSIGFAPNFDGFAEPGPALIIGGQCEFARFGDVITADISFHAMYIGFPESGSSAPQVYFDKLRVDISSSEGFRIGGRVDTYDDRNLAGFAGEGTVAIPGFPELSAAFSFGRLRSSPEDPWVHAWFVAIEASKISYQITPLPIFLRQVGLGFGYRFTLPLILEFEKQKSIGELMRSMLAALDKHQTLASIDSWQPDVGASRRSLWTIAIEAAFTLGTSQARPFDYDPKQEQKLKTLVAQIIAAFRSDFTLVSAVKIWFPVSIDDFFLNKESMRSRPLASGFMIYSAPQNRFLAHAAKGPDPYMGPKDKPVPEIVKDILRKVHFEATLLIEPGLLHGELGWPDRLMFSFDLGGLKLECRGGVLFRLERDVLIQGTYFAGRGSLDLGGGIDLGFIGVRIETHAVVQFGSRMLTAQYPLRLLDSKIYAQHGLDIAVRFSLKAWFRKKIGCFNISIDIDFSFEVQIAVAMEMGWAGGLNLGFRARAIVMVAVFGRRLSIAVAVGVNEGGVNGARQALGPYMGSLLEAGRAPPMPGFDNAGLGQKAVATLARRALVIDAEEDIADRFVTAHMERGKDSDGKTSWFVWIMPGHDAGTWAYFYPPTGDVTEKKRTEYAILDLNWTEGDVYYLGDTGAWVKAGTTVTLYSSSGKRLSTEQDEGQLTFCVDNLIAGCWVPDADSDDIPFPASWPTPAPPLAAPAKPVIAEAPLVDARVFERDGPARKPTYQRHGTHVYDQTLAVALDGDDDELVAANQQALGNQGLVMQAYHDELVRITNSATVTVDDKGNVAINVPQEAAGRPTPFDLGMVICVRAAEKPAWIKERSDGIKFPTLKFLPAYGGQEKKPFVLKPAVKHELLDFEQNPPAIRDLTTYFDDDVISVAFPIDWGGDRPEATDFAGNEVQDIEAFVRAYEISFFDLDSQSVIKTATVSPSESIVKQKDNSYDRINTRYKYSVPSAQILPAASLQDSGRVHRLGVSVVPISQTGLRGRKISSTVRFEPSSTPLPADAARLTFRYDISKKIRKISYRLDWRQLTLPSKPGVAVTLGWDLILRPLRNVPLGSYPDGTLDINDRGLMSATGQTLIEGDIVIALDDQAFKKTRPNADDLKADRAEGRDPADWKIDLNFDKLGAGNLPGKVYDHAGRFQAQDTSLYAEAKSFFNRISAADPGGKAWRLFLRASSQQYRDLPAQRLGTGLSGLSVVDLALSIEDDTAVPERLRPLPHFEWIKPDDKPPQVKHADLRKTKVGAVTVGVVSPPEVDGKPLEIRFVPKPGTGRAITLAWNAVPSPSEKPARKRGGDKPPPPTPPAAFAGYDLFELRQDALLNADLMKGNEEFRPEWRWLKHIAPTEAVLARQTPLAMTDTTNWECQTPAFAKSSDFLSKTKVDPRNQSARWPGWYSWAESELLWPAPFVFTHGGDKLDTESPTLPKKADSKLCYWRDHGFSAARWLRHDYLAALIGCLVYRGRSLSNPRYEVQAMPSGSSTVTDPRKWLDANNEGVDPYGWAALSTLGLLTAFTLRDSASGLPLSPEMILSEFTEALKQVEIAIDAADPGQPAKRISRHLFVDVPLQHLRAYKSREEPESFDDAGLSLLQVSLRPLPQQDYSRLKYEVFKITYVGRDETFNTDCEIIFANSERPSINMKADGARTVQATFKNGDIVLVRSRGGERDKLGYFLREIVGSKLDLADASGNEYPESPLPLLQYSGKADSAYSPFGRFAPRIEDWISLLGTDYSKDDEWQGSTLRDFLYYLTEAFRRPEDEDKLPAWRDEIIKNGEPDSPKAKFVRSYLSWSARFFRAAPLDVGEGKRSEADPAAWMAVAQPKTVEPQRTAADARGVITHVRFLDEELAGVRTFAVMPVGRYDKFWAGLELDPEPETRTVQAKPEEPPYRTPELGGKDIIHAKIERVRMLEPPKLLAARAVRNDKGRPFNEIILAHAERELSTSNTTVSGKLSFGEIEREHTRRFKHGDWIDVLKDDREYDGVGSSVPQLPAPTSRLKPSPEEHHSHASTAATVLFVAPQARWGASRHLDAAEPFYYEQSVKLWAKAGSDVRSIEKKTVLPSHDPDPLAPAPEGGNPVAASNLKWLDVRPEREPFYQMLKNVLSIHEIVEHLLPEGFALDIRLPRFIESLKEGSLSAHFAYEADTGGGSRRPVGMLPDRDVRTLVLSTGYGSVSTIAKISAKSQNDGNGAFTKETPAAEFSTLIAIGRPDSDWPKGIHAQVSTRPNFSLVETSFEPAQTLKIFMPSGLGDLDPSGPTAEDLLPEDTIPGTGSYLNLGPLALRLHLYANKLAMTGPLNGPQYLCRPSMNIDKGSPTLTQADLAFGMRLAADRERVLAAALVCHDFDATDDENGRVLDQGAREECLRVMRLTEVTDFAVLLDRGSYIPAKDGEMLAGWSKLGMDFWERYRRDSGLYGWKLIASPSDNVKEWVLLTVASVRAKGADMNPITDIVDYLQKTGLASRHPDFDPAKVLATNDVFTSLAKLAWRSGPFLQPSVFAQRGNEPAVRWGSVEMPKVSQP
ncbi:hypothetical protein NKH99_25465 [Mesorhizobium sp. M0854]|uniref:hypothetical protein n=1 Tax=Mesorhizobium sp. M0854 TaxID=2957013 RepID=UPI003339881E